MPFMNSLGVTGSFGSMERGFRYSPGKKTFHDQKLKVGKISLQSYFDGNKCQLNNPIRRKTLRQTNVNEEVFIALVIQEFDVSFVVAT